MMIAQPACLIVSLPSVGSDFLLADGFLECGGRQTARVQDVDQFLHLLLGERAGDLALSEILLVSTARSGARRRARCPGGTGSRWPRRAGGCR